MNRILMGLFMLCGLLWAQDQSEGQAVYDKYCNQCHGVTGLGDGYAADYVIPRPRDLSSGVFKFRSTENGLLPTRDDVLRVVREGIYGTSMPAFGHIGEEKLEQVVSFIETFYQSTIDNDTKDGLYPPKPIAMSDSGKVTNERLANGRRIYEENGCRDCHGNDGRADGPSSLTLKDDNERSIKPANLAASWRFRSGDRLSDIYRAFSTGISGTPMPSYMDSINDQDRWDLSAYVRSLSPETAPEASPQIVARKLEGELPTTMDDERWQTAQEAYFPLTAQILWEPVNINPTVFDVRVRACHDDRDLVMMLSWDDPSFSLAGMNAAVAAEDEEDDFWGSDEDEADEEEDDFWGDEEEEADDTPTEVFSDAFALQFPSGLPKNDEKPYFVMGDKNDPVNLWQWTNHEGIVRQTEDPSDADAVKYMHTYLGEGGMENIIAKGHSQLDGTQDGAALTVQVRYHNGRYTLLLRRTLSSPNSDDVQIVPGQFVPIAFWAWDGHNGEQGIQASLSSWYYLVLEQPMGRSSYVNVGLAILATILFQVWAVWAAKRKRDTQVVQVPAT